MTEDVFALEKQAEEYIICSDPSFSIKVKVLPKEAAEALDKQYVSLQIVGDKEQVEKFWTTLTQMIEEHY